MSYFIGVDIGGTFTDCVAVADDGALTHAKVFSDRERPSEGMARGIERLASTLRTDTPGLLGAAERMSHGTTIGTNLIVERTGAEVLLVTTAGHGDVLQMMRGFPAAGLPRQLLYDLHAHALPAPLVPRDRIVEVHERVDASGAIVAPLDVGAAREAIGAIVADHAIEAVAISLLWSFLEPAHEERLAELVAELIPEATTSLSSRVAPRMGEFERTVATVLDAYVAPASTRYLERAAGELAARGLRQPLLVMQSNGGVVDVDRARSAPLRAVDSGPAGGLVGTTGIAARLGHSNVIATDMGGTSFDVGLVVDGQPTWASQRVIDRWTYSVPHLDVRSIACGGGSIATVDPHARSLRVGPRSAGSTPGPACYGRGGTSATVTDADVVLGLMASDARLGGHDAIDAEAAHRAVGELAAALGLSVDEAAAGIVTINNHAAATLIRQRTIERGLDPRDFVLYAFGGAGPLHAFGFATDLALDEVVVPLANGASTLSAYGIASTDAVEHVEVAGRIAAPFPPEAVAELATRAVRQATAALVDQGFAEDEAVVERELLLRYEGQYMQSLPIALGGGEVDAAACADVLSRFEEEYARLYGEGARLVFQAVEIFGARARAAVGLPFSHAADVGTGRATVADATRSVFWPGLGERIATTVLTDASAVGEAPTDGPVIVDLPHTSVAVAPGQQLRRDAGGHLILHTSGAAR